MKKKGDQSSAPYMTRLKREGGKRSHRVAENSPATLRMNLKGKKKGVTLGVDLVGGKLASPADRGKREGIPQVLLSNPGKSHSIGKKDSRDPTILFRTKKGAPSTLLKTRL